MGLLKIASSEAVQGWSLLYACCMNGAKTDGTTLNKILHRLD